MIHEFSPNCPSCGSTDFAWIGKDDFSSKETSLSSKIKKLEEITSPWQTPMIGVLAATMSVLSVMGLVRFGGLTGLFAIGVAVYMWFTFAEVQNRQERLASMRAELNAAREAREALSNTWECSRCKHRWEMQHPEMTG